METTEQQRQLLIDYSKNTAPLQTDGGRERLQVGMSIRYHEPEFGRDELMDISANSLGGSSKGHQVPVPPNPSFPLQFLDQVEKEYIMTPKEQFMLSEEEDNNKEDQAKEEEENQKEQQQQAQNSSSSSLSLSPNRGRERTSPTGRRKNQSKSPTRRTRSKSLSKSPSRSPRRSRSKSKSPSRSPTRNGAGGKSPRRGRRKLKKKESKITFKVPPKETVRRRGGRFQTQKSYRDVEESLLADFLLDDASNHTMPTTLPTSYNITLTTNDDHNMRGSIISTAETLMTTSAGTVNTFADQSTMTNDMSIRTAPAAVRLETLTQGDEEEDRPRGRNSLEKKLRAMSPPRRKISNEEREEGKVNLDDDDEDDSDEDEKRTSASFLPTGLTASSSQEEADNQRSTLRRSRSKKKKQTLSLDEYFNKEDTATSGSTRSLRRSKTPTRSNRRKQQFSQQQGGGGGAASSSPPPFGRSLTLDDAGSRNRTRNNSIGSQTSFRSQLNDDGSALGQSYPTGPRLGRLLPAPKSDRELMSSSLEATDSSRSLNSTATSNTRRGGRKKGGGSRSRDNSPRRGGVVRSLSSADVPSGSYRNLKSLENSHSFMAGSRIRVRRTGTPTSINHNNSNHSSSSSNRTDTTTTSGGRGGGRGLLGRHRNHRSNDDDDDDASEASSLMILTPNPPMKRTATATTTTTATATTKTTTTTTSARRGTLSRSKSCEGMPALVRPS